MNLDESKLENARKKRDGKIIARCPACSQDGADRRGEHLVIYPSGKYGCVAHPGDKEHKKKIFRLVGTTPGPGRPPMAVEIRRPACATREPRVLQTIYLLPPPKGALTEYLTCLFALVDEGWAMEPAGTKWDDEREPGYDGHFDPVERDSSEISDASDG